MNNSATFYLCVCLAVGGCVGAEPNPEANPEADEPDTATAEQALGSPQLNAIDNRSFGGNLFAENFPYVIGSNCSAGYVRLDSPGTQWTSQAGGFCAFQGWLNPGNPHDCHANILAHTGGGFFGGSCLSWVYEQQQGLRGFSASNTSSAQANTTNQAITLNAGQTLTIGTCGVPDASFTGDTYLRLRDPAGNQVALNDDNCSGLGSQIVFAAPATGTYEIRIGCFSSTSCSGTVAWTIH